MMQSRPGQPLGREMDHLFVKKRSLSQQRRRNAKSALHKKRASSKDVLNHWETVTVETLQKANTNYFMEK